ncbi:MAG: hypothetical protein JJU20_01970 [Opitutales bacterium]|nr:hypothetical protein [Opitutales bacterium]
MNSPLDAILIVFIVIGIPIICVTLIVLAKILKGSGSGSNASGNAEDLKILTELNRNLNRMEERIEALETIIIERQKSKNS